MAALWAIDQAMEAVVARATDPMLARVKLAWWREQLEALDSAPPPAEPRLQAVAEHLPSRGVAGTDVAALEPGWATLLDQEPDPALVQERGVHLFRLSARLLGAADPSLDQAGALYGLTSAARAGAALPHELIDRACGQLRKRTVKRGVRPVTALARLGVRDARTQGSFEDQGSGVRAAAVLLHRWSGRLADA